MKLEHREITELHLLALAEWDRRPKLVWFINKIYITHVRVLVWLIRIACRLPIGGLR
jgi:hypothetical protein